MTALVIAAHGTRLPEGQQACRELVDRVRAMLPGVRVLSADSPRTAIVSFLTEDAHPHDLGTLLDHRGIAVRTGNHCAQPLLDCLGIGPTTRASFAIYNTRAEVDRHALHGEPRAASSLRTISSTTVLTRRPSVSTVRSATSS